MLSDETKRKISSYLVLVIFFLYKSSESLLQPSVRIFIYKQVCIQESQRINISTSQCDKSNDNQQWKTEFSNVATKMENHIQREASKYLLGYRILLNVPALFFCLFAGSWSDRVGRKFPMMLPPLGAVCATILFTVSNMKNVNSLAWLLGGAFVYGIFGKSTVMTMATSSYVVDTTSKVERTELLGRLLAMNFFGIFLGSLLTGVLLDFADMNTIFITIVTVNLILEIVIMVCIKESVDLSQRPQNCLQMLVPCVNIEKKRLTIMDSLGTLFNKRVKQGTLIFLLVSLCVNQILKQGEQDVILLLVEHAPFKWPGQWYGYYLSVYYACMGINLICILPVISKYFSPMDSSLVMFGITMKIIRLIITSLAQVSWLLFFSAVIGCFAGFIVSATKSMVSKIIDEDEIGQTFSLLSCAEALANLLGPIIFTQFYSATVVIFPGMIFTLDAAIHFILLGCFFKLYLTERAESEDTEGELRPIINNAGTDGKSMPSISVFKTTKAATDQDGGPCQDGDLLTIGEGRRGSAASIKDY